MDMKRHLTLERMVLLAALTLMIMVTSSAVLAQSPAKLLGNQFEFGLRGGISSAELVCENSSSSGVDNRTTFTAGAFWAFPVSSRFAIQPELTYKRYGHSYYMVFTSEEYPDGYAEGVFSRKLDYIAISSMVRYQPLSQGMVLPFLLAGPRVDFNILSEQGLEDDYYDIPNNKKVTLGLDVGGGVVFNLRLPVFIDLRGSLGLTSVYELYGIGFDRELGDTPIAPPDYHLSVKGNMLSITAGVIFM